MKQRNWNPAQLDAPLRWRKPYLVTLDLDLFDGMTDEQIAAVFGVMAACPSSIFRVWTAHPKRARKWFKRLDDSGIPPISVCEIEASNRIDCDQNNPPWPLRNVWIGIIAHTQAELDERAPEILACPAALHWLRLVLHEQVVVQPFLQRHWTREDGDCSPACPACIRRRRYGLPLDVTIGHIDVSGAIGKDAPPCDEEWIRDVIRQGHDAGVPVYVRALGASPYLDTRNAPREYIGIRGILRPCGPYGRSYFGIWPLGLQVREWPEGVEVEG